MRVVWLRLLLITVLISLLAVGHLKLLPIALHAIAERHGLSTVSVEHMGLQHYRAAVQAVPIGGVKANVSGLTFNRQTHTLFAVVNKPPEVIELDTQGIVLRRLALEGMHDTEGITHVAGDIFVISEERENRLRWIRMPPRGRSTELQVEASLKLDWGQLRNLGYEGLSWDESHSELWLINEKWPKRVLMVSGFLPSSADAPRQVDVRQWDLPGALSPIGSDLSSISVQSSTGNILFLSAESSVLVETSRTGDVLGTMPLWRGWHGLTSAVPQPEGVTVGPNGDVFIVSEPNLFYRFSRTER